MNGDVLNVIVNTARALPFHRPEFKTELLRFSPTDKDGAPYATPGGSPTRDDEVQVWVYLHNEWPRFPVFVLRFRALQSWKLSEVRDGVERALGKNRGERRPLIFDEMDENETIEEAHINGYVHINLRRPRNAPANVISIAGVDFVPGPGVNPADPPEEQVLNCGNGQGWWDGGYMDMVDRAYCVPRAVVTHSGDKATWDFHLGIRVSEDAATRDVLEWIRSRLQLGHRRHYICHHFYVLKAEGTLRDIGFNSDSCFSLFIKYGAPPAALQNRQIIGRHQATMGVTLKDVQSALRQYRWDALRVMHEGRLVSVAKPLSDQGIRDGHTLSLVHIESATTVSPVRPEPKLLIHRNPGMTENGTVRALFGGVRIQVAETAGAHIGSNCTRKGKFSVLIYDVGPDTLVGELQEQVRERTGINYRLLREDGTVLDISHTVAQAGLVDGEQLDLLVELIGGGSKTALSMDGTPRPRPAEVYTLTRGDFARENHSQLPINAVALQMVGDVGQWWIVMDQDAPLQKAVSLMEIMTERKLRAVVDGERITMNHSARFYGFASADQVDLYEEQRGGGSLEPVRRDLHARIADRDSADHTGGDEHDDSFSETRGDPEATSTPPTAQASQPAFPGNPAQLAFVPAATPLFTTAPRLESATLYGTVSTYPPTTPMYVRTSPVPPPLTFATMFPSPKVVQDIPAYTPLADIKRCPERLMPRSLDEAYKYGGKYSRQFISRYEQMGRLCGATGEDLCDYLRFHVHDRSPDIFSIIERQAAYRLRDWESVKRYILTSFEGPESERYTVVDWQRFVEQPRGITSVVTLLDPTQARYHTASVRWMALRGQ
ncbi:hypothetical protein V8E36_001142 [Tilletia maclaganii]